MVLCSFAYKAGYGQYVLASLCQETQQEQAAHPEAALYLNTHLDSVLGCAHHSKGCWSHHRTRHKDWPAHCSWDESFKGTTRSNAVFLLSGSGPRRTASRTSCSGRSWWFSAHTFKDLWSLSHRAVIQRTGCGVLHLVMGWPGHSYGPLSVD